ncbi:methyl-accepting chemotaxis protein [Vibrio crassostreae]|uniref:Methyl-accepting chemotaxis protein n=3 Tax=Vibrio TaxID=662 RepID=A0A4R3PBJ1_9VIBR|nr:MULTISPECIES: methyl-accepting chemotaxis protein [Vibrio]APB62096.1 Methyl-accepting chemotaxis protein [Vibrio crassostreae]MDH5924086.1 methyl-accepting chemotaxis protein [Vibrio splendidus]MDH5951868.1 methyl-accepting chemotaxis protein [Vibrio crassostreae]NOH77166.1 methyl-accepting chemotaxis protein [Vibrio crassostreae]NOI55359.1 methyl-accepting chemotaxis protein [Vibrio crassostreae]
MLDNVYIKTKIQMTIGIATILMLVSGVFNLYLQREEILEERHDKIQTQVETAVSLVQYFRTNKSLEKKDAQAAAKKALSALRYDDNNYFWVTNTNNKLIIHPRRPNSIGQDMTNIRDSKGNYHWQEMSRIAKKNSSGFLNYTWSDPQGKEKDKISYVSYIPEWDWIIGSGLLISDIQEDVYTNIIQQSILLAIIIGILFSISFLIGNSIVKPIEQFIENVNIIASGNLTTSFQQNRTDEIGELNRGLCKMQTTIRGTLIAAQSTADKASLLAESIASTSEETAQSLASQNSQLEQISTAMSEMSATINNVAMNAEYSSEKTSEASRQAQTSSQSMVTTLEDVSAISLSIDETTQLMATLKHGVDNIGQVVQVIQEVSEQTNLLALNAAIEAARAGEQGRGFAVVADEVRNLASRTQDSTSQVQSTINELLASTSEVLIVMESNNSSINMCVETAQQTKDTLVSMVSSLNGANDMVAQIAASAEQQGIVSNEMSENVSTIHLSAREINQASVHMAYQTQEMASAAEELKQLLTYFKLK